MGNSAVFRIHTGDDADEAYAMAQRLLNLRARCGCSSDVSVSAEVGTHADLGRYLAIDEARVQLSVPRELIPLVRELESHGLYRHRSGHVSLLADLTPTVVTALRRVPPMTASISCDEVPLPSDLAREFLVVVEDDPGTISWMTCWPGTHGASGFEMAVNGAQTWHPDPPAGHSVYVHVDPRQPDDAHALAAAVGGRVLGGPYSGW